MSATLRDVPGRPAASTRPAISLTSVSKSFKLPHEAFHTLKQRALHPLRAIRFDVLQAVDGVTLQIAEGEFFGIVGRNGSGKSTLLKCLAGIYEIDAGSIEVRGRLSPFIELGVGFNPDLTARDNAIINAIMLGLSRGEARRRFDEIIAFAELEEFVDLKLKNFSSGMQVRLAFAVAIQVDAEILLIDEVLAVGDAAFQQKCFDEFLRLKAAGRTIVFVTHDMGAVERFCDRAMVMERGGVVDIGAPASIARQYNELNFRRVRQEASESGGPEPLRRPAVAELRTARFESAGGDPLVSCAQGDPCRVRLDVRFHAATENPVLAIALINEVGVASFATNTELAGTPMGRFQAGDHAIVTLRFENWLAPGRYRLMASITRDGYVANVYDLREDISSIVVTAGRSGGGAMYLPHTLEIERG